MMIKITTCLFALAFFTACESQSTASRQTLAERRLAATTGTSNSIEEPAPPAEGPEDVSAERSLDPTRNPALLPTPLLRSNAAADL